MIIVPIVGEIVSSELDHAEPIITWRGSQKYIRIHECKRFTPCGS